MKKKWIAIGLILVLSGLIMIPIGINSTSIGFISDTKSPTYTETNSWNISGYFKENRKLTLTITTNNKWGLMAADFWGDLPEEFAMLNETIKGLNMYYIYLTVNITDPKNGTTMFRVLYVTPKNPSSNTLAPPLRLFSVAVSFNDGGLKFPDELVVKENNYLYLKEDVGGDVWGITTYSGTYKVSIKEDSTLKVFGPPLKLKLESALVVKESPYYFLVPIGGVVVSTGVVSSLLGTKASKKPRKVYRKGYKNKRSKIK